MKPQVRFSPKESGQILIVAAFAISGILAFVALAIEIDMYRSSSENANEKASIACRAAAIAYLHGENYDVAFSQSLIDNNILVEAYSPKEGMGANLTRGLGYSNSSFRVALKWSVPTVMLFVAGVDTLEITGRSRCSMPGASITPIAVRESAFKQSETPEYTILGNDPNWELADVESGENFRGVVFTHMWCDDPNDVGITNCPEQRVFAPLLEAPPSAQTQKALMIDCFAGINCSIEMQLDDPDNPDDGPATHLPIVSGTSNNQLCQSFMSNHSVGDEIVVLVFNGTVNDPDPMYGNWENVKVLYYATYEVTAFLPGPNNCTHVTAKRTGGPFYSLSEIPGDLFIREITWDYIGDLP